MILIKGHSIDLTMANGRHVVPKKTHGFIHDPSGDVLDRCAVFIGPYSKSREKVALTGKAWWYFGPGQTAVKAHIDVPKGPWDSLGRVREILYDRIGNHDGPYVHAFASSKRPMLGKCGAWYRLLLPADCVLDWRGFVYP